MNVAGRPLPHDSAWGHVTGEARYVDDIPAPANCLHLAFGLSSEAHAEIADIDLSEVRAAPGVVAVLTAADLPFANDVSPSPSPEPLLAEERVHYVGQPIFLVVAESHLAARRAARLGRISYRPLEPILTVDEALAADSRFEEGPRIWTRGTPHAALAGAPHRLSGSIEIGGQEHFYLEGQAALVLPGEGGDMTVISSTQHPTEIQHKVAEAIGRPMHAVRVETRRMGGGFGGKESQGNALAVACAIAARATGRPARMRYDRDDDMTITGKRHDMRIDYEAGFDDDGRLIAVNFRHLVRCGWSQDLSLPVADRAMLHADNAYFLPHVRIESHRLRTNTQSATAFRGFGGPQGMLGIERVIEHVAHVLGRDPLEVRRLNYYAPAQGAAAAAAPRAQAAAAPAGTSGRNVTHYGQEVDDFGLHEMTDRLAREAEYHRRREEIARWNAREAVLRRGIALTPVKFGISFTLTHLNQAGALVHVYQDGSVQLNHGGTEMGQGLFRKVAQVAAAEFGLPIEAVRITATDTGKVPNTSATAASSGSDLNGMAVRDACLTLKRRIAAHLATEGQDPQAARFEDGRVILGNRSWSFAEAARLAYEGRVSLSATGFYRTPRINWDRVAGHGRPFFYFAYGVACTEAVIDTLTGENRLLRVDILHDTGRSLNPAIDIGQIEGGFVQGAGWLTCEELWWDDSGRLRTHAPSTYKIPAFSDQPDVLNVTLLDRPNREETIYRSKAVGEPPLMLAISAFQAIGHAVSFCGPHWHGLEAPATPEHVLEAIARARGEPLALADEAAVDRSGGDR